MLVNMVLIRYYYPMSTPSPQYTIERLANLIRGETRNRLTQYGLLPVQLEALHYLAICNRYSDTPMAVTEFLGQTKGTVSQTLKVLEKKGLIQKSPDQKDKRVTHLQITTEGRHLAEEFVTSPLLTKAIEQLPQNTAELLQVSLNNLLRNAQQINQFKPFGVCATCIHHRKKEDGEYICNLTKEALTENDVTLICREHAYAD